MKRKMSVLIAGVLVALLVVGVIGATGAYAQDAGGVELRGGGPWGGRGLGLEALQVTAEALDMTTDELITALRSGKTLEDLADEAGVDLEEVQEAIRAARAEEMRERIQQAVDEGAITQEHADWLLEGLDNGFLGGPGGFGFGRHRGPGFGPALEPIPDAEPTGQGG